MFAEVRSATRGLLRWRGGAVVAVLTLAVGVGTTTGLYALVRVVLADMPDVPAIEQVGRIYAAAPALGVERGLVALNEFDTGLAKASSFQAIGAYADEDAVVGSGTSSRPVVAGYASPGFFTVMRVPPIAGRVFTAADLSGPPVAIVSDALWRRQFPDGHLGTATLLVDGVERAVIGVMPPGFRYPFVGISADLWVPLGRASVTTPAIVAVFARLGDGVAWPAAQAQLAGLARASKGGQGPWTWQAIPIPRDTRSRALAAYAGTLGPAFLLLLIACVNVACLLLARGIAREKELTVRLALGATRAAIVRLLLVESVVLAAVSGALGGVLALWILGMLSSTLAPFQPAMAAALSANMRLLPVVLAATAVACVLSGLVPALRLSKRDVAASLNGVPARHRLDIAGYGARDAVAFGEIAASVGFVVWAAMIYTLFAQLNHVRLTFAADRVIAVRVPAGSVPNVAARIAAIPGVAATAISSGMLGGGSRERAEVNGTSRTIARIPVGGGFFETLGVPMLRGRGFDASEENGHASVAVISESAARQLAPGGDAVGLRLKTSRHGEITVIGICRDPIDYGAVRRIDAAAADIYVPYELGVLSSDAVVLARTSADAHATIPAVADAARMPTGVRPPRPVVLDDDFAQRYGSQGAMLTVRILGAFALMTLLLAASGVFAVINQSVTQRTRELGIRLAIGATPSRVLRLVLAREAQLIGAGVATGVVFTVLATRALFSELVTLNTLVPGTWLGALLLSGGVAAFAVACATYRIVRLEPSVVLRRS